MRTFYLKDSKFVQLWSHAEMDDTQLINTTVTH